MKHKLIILCGILAITANMAAQTPKWAAKAVKSVFTLKTFAADGTLIGSACGFFTSNDGEAVSSYTPFKGAQRAVIIDEQGKEQAVTLLLGANEMYDIIRFKVDSKKTTPLTIAATPAAEQATVWLLPYATRKHVDCIQGTVSKTEPVLNSHTYYTMLLKSESEQIGSPILNDNGEVLGILQPAADSQKADSYAVSVKAATELKLGALSLNESALRATGIAKAIPDDQTEAQLSLFVAPSAMSETAYDDYVNRFIKQFPKSSDGYLSRARFLINKGDNAAAEQDLTKAIEVADDKVIMNSLKSWEIPFSEVEEFFFTDITKQLIGIHYKNDAEAQTLENASGIESTARKMNKMLVGAQEGIPTYRLSMKPQALLDLLNQRLEAYRGTHA